jgi:hypothetical protein
LRLLDCGSDGRVHFVELHQRLRHGCLLFALRQIQPDVQRPGLPDELFHVPRGKGRETGFEKLNRVNARRQAGQLISAIRRC